jgi:glycosyltransferase involved in cell wall biosynthesis
MTLSRHTSVIVPAFNEEHAVGAIVAGLRGAAEWLEILVVDDGSSDGTADQAALAGARVVRHPYNKGNGAAVKTGIRRCAGDYVLIVDGDGQHRAADAATLVAGLETYDLVVGA